jgi:hypothetical protein
MKTTSSILVLIAATTLLHAAPQPAQASPEDLAKQKVATEIYAKVSSRSVAFSRADLGPSHQLQFQPQMLVKEESRLPFAISRSRGPKGEPELQGYVRLSDQAIFLLDPKTGQHRLASEDPRFTPTQQQRELPFLKIEPSKPL